MAPSLVATFDATAEVDGSSNPLPGASHSAPAVVADIGPPLGGAPSAPMFCAYCAQTAGCSSRQYCSMARLVPAGSLSVTGRMGRFGIVTFSLAPCCLKTGSSQLVT